MLFKYVLAIRQCANTKLNASPFSVASYLLRCDREPLVEDVLGVVLRLQICEPLIVLPEHVAGELVAQAIVRVLTTYNT